MSVIRRREFVILLGGMAAAWPLAARAQQPAMPVVGLSPIDLPRPPLPMLAAFRQGLNDPATSRAKRDVEYHWRKAIMIAAGADGRPLLRRGAVIVTGGDPSALAAKAATSTIPIVFGFSGDPVKLGFVASLARPGGNATGINFLTAEVAAKRLELLRDMVPGATVWPC